MQTLIKKIVKKYFGVYASKGAKEINRTIMLTKTIKSKISTEDNQITCKIKFRLNFTIYLFFWKLSNNYETTISLGKICYLK